MDIIQLGRATLQPSFGGGEFIFTPAFVREIAYEFIQMTKHLAQPTPIKSFNVTFDTEVVEMGILIFFA